MVIDHVLAELARHHVSLRVDAGELVLHGPKRGRAAVRALVKQAKPALIAHLRASPVKENSLDDAREVMWRADAMRQQLGVNPKVIPFLLARQDAPSVRGRCMSCGEPVHRARHRCDWCVEAVSVVLQDMRINAGLVH